MPSMGLARGKLVPVRRTPRAPERHGPRSLGLRGPCRSDRRRGATGRPSVDGRQPATDRAGLPQRSAAPARAERAPACSGQRLGRGARGGGAAEFGPGSRFDVRDLPVRTPPRGEAGERRPAGRQPALAGAPDEGLASPVGSHERPSVARLRRSEACEARRGVPAAHDRAASDRDDLLPRGGGKPGRRRLRGDAYPEGLPDA
jgi:hypothetical protein